MKKILSLMVAFTVVGCGRETAPEPPIAEASVAEPVIVKPVAEIIPAEPPPPPSISIWDAARAGDLEAVRGHIDSRENLDEPDAGDPLKPTPLHCAVASGHKAVAELLLTRGVDINAAGSRYSLSDVNEGSPFCETCAKATIFLKPWTKAVAPFSNQLVR